MAAVAWVGGSLFYAVALHPALEELGPTPERVALVRGASREFREVVRLSILVFVVTGAVLAVSRLTFTRLPLAYVVVLAVKVALSLGMFWLAGLLGPRRGRPNGEERPKRQGAWWLRPQYLILELGAVVYLLSLVLRMLFEQALVLAG